MGKPDFAKLAPPGARLGLERTVFLLCEAAAVLNAAVVYGDHFGNARANLYEWTGSRKYLIRDAVMPPFPELLEDTMRLFPLALAAMLGLVLWHYLSYRQGSMSIYLMKRLPDKNLLHRQCWTLPLLGAALYVLTALLLVGIFYLIYLYCTPAGHLPPVMGR